MEINWTQVDGPNHAKDKALLHSAVEDTTPMFLGMESFLDRRHSDFTGPQDALDVMAALDPRVSWTIFVYVTEGTMGTLKMLTKTLKYDLFNRTNALHVYSTLPESAKSSLIDL